MKKHKLSEQQRAFFKSVCDAAFSNPFSDSRLTHDLRITGSPSSIDRFALISRVISKVTEETGNLERAGMKQLGDFNAEDREIMFTSYLFEIFHNFIQDFDAHIIKQNDSGDTPLSVTFTPKIMAAFRRRGFSDMETGRYMAFFFQLRRAFYFLEQNLSGNSPSMMTLKSTLWNNIFTHDIKWFRDHLWDRMEDFSTLLLGETGTGKGAAAAAIGRSGHIPFDANSGKFTESFTKNFISRNLSQYPESLIESELFGHKKGSFTGAVSDYKGIFSQCSPHGAIFLDEVGDVSVPTQIKLLQVLQERVFSPVGSHEQLRFNGRIIAATNRPLKKLRSEGEFRNDFYYRLSSDVITVPTLRQRVREDSNEIRILLHSVICRTVSHCTPELVDEVAEILRENLGENYDWPGNVRELEQAVRRIFLSGRYNGETADEDLGLDEKFHTRISRGEQSAQEMLHDYCYILHRRHGTYEKVSSITGLDRRTVKKYIEASKLQ